MKHTAIPLEIYSLHLSTINNIKFSKREIDIIACILSGRSAKGIAHFLSIAPKTAEVHIYNVMKKLGCNSRDNVITLIQNSDKFLIVKQYYLSLLTYITFEESLKKIAQLIGNKRPTCFIVSDKEQNQTILLQQLKSNLDLVGLKTILETRKQNEPTFNLIQKTKTEDFLIFYTQTLVSEEDYKDISNATQELKTFCFVFENEEEKNKNNLKKLDDVQCVTLTNYYSSVFEILQSFFPEIKIQEIVKKFETQDTFTQESQSNQTQKEHALGVEKTSEFLKIPLLKYRQWGILISSVLILGGLSIGILNYKELKPIDFIARSDLILPSENLLLNRPELISKIEEKLTEKPGIQTVALVGMGGVGKTTLARQYGRQQHASIVWEINAETNDTLRSSFETLSQILAKTEEDQKEVRALQEIKNLDERDGKILLFVRNHLKMYSNWVLIYDNVEKFSDIQKYFPHDPSNWGIGKVLITTRDSNIQNDNHVNYVIQIGELSSNQKLALFSKILGNEKPEQLTEAREEEAQQFLEKIPPFPLDVSVAAYYLKATNVPYEKYLGYINQNNHDFAKTHEQILKEASNYSKTRYSIITASLQNLINSHKDFADLLLLISLIDSQNIPRDLLVKYKNDIIVDNFIYHLKKYSLITIDSNDIYSNGSFSIHRNIQEVSIKYLNKLANFQKNNRLLDSIFEALIKEIEETTEQEDTQKMMILTKHVKKFLSHEKLMNNTVKITLEGQLGFIYFNLGMYERAENLLRKNLAMCESFYGKDHPKTAWIMMVLGGCYRSLIEPIMARDLLEQSLRIYKNYTGDNHRNISDILVHLSHVYRNLGDYLKAKKHMEQGIEILRKDSKKYDLKLGSALVGLGIINMNLGNYIEADTLIIKGLAIYTKRLGNQHIKTGWALVILGANKRNLGDYLEAKKILKQGCAIYKKYYGSNHFETAEKYLHLSQTYVNLRDKENAVKLSGKSYLIIKNYFGENHISTAEAAARLGESLCLIGDFNQAKAFLEKSYLIHEHHYGKNNILTLHILRSLGELHLYMNNLDVAEKMITNVNGILEKMDHSKAYLSLELLARLYKIRSQQAKKNGAIREAKKHNVQAAYYLEKALKLIEKHYTKDSPHWKKCQSKMIDL